MSERDRRFPRACSVLETRGRPSRRQRPGAMGQKAASKRASGGEPIHARVRPVNSDLRVSSPGELRPSCEFTRRTPISARVRRARARSSGRSNCMAPMHLKASRLGRSSAARRSQAVRTSASAGLSDRPRGVVGRAHGAGVRARAGRGGRVQRARDLGARMHFMNHHWWPSRSTARQVRWAPCSSP